MYANEVQRYDIHGGYAEDLLYLRDNEVPIAFYAKNRKVRLVCVLQIVRERDLRRRVN